MKPLRDEGNVLWVAFGEACRLESGAREEYLARIDCEDPSRGRRLRALLEADASGSDPLESGLPACVVEDALRAAAWRAGEDPPRDIGPYRVLRRLGEGGMGEVFLAQQEEPIQREVALKVMRAGMESAETRSRFEQECAALASLDHPHVARVFDAGVTAHGHPFFAMEVVVGAPLVEHCNQKGLDLDARLALLVEICGAIEHAHRKGIIHRDLKPSNVLVTADAGCKVIDFGIAKRTDTERAGARGLTSVGQFLGTPAYMSPEQAAEGSDVDTRTDVYSLGVLLYELLVDRRPADEELARATSLAAMLRATREHEPIRPSHLRADLDPELDWITLRALEKDRERRYRSPAALADDLERYRRHEPVTAGPPGTAYRLRKFIRRNRAGVAAACVLLLALVTVLGATSVSFVDAIRSQRSARAANDDLRRLADLDLLHEAEREAAALWPVDSGRLEALEGWLVSYARPLAARLDRHRTRLATLRGRLAPLSAAEREEQHSKHPLVEQLRSARLLLDNVRRRQRETAWVGWGPALKRFTDEVHDLERELDRRQTFRFASRRDQWEHDTLEDLVHGLERFLDPDPWRGAVASVEWRVAAVERLDVVERTTCESDVWSAAIEAFRSSAHYDGLELTPEPGLVPLGPDPASGLWEFWHVASGERPRPSVDPDTHSRWDIEAGTGIVLVLIPGGTYRLGAQCTSPSNPHFDPRARSVETVHEVELWPFLISKYELTSVQWERLSGRRQLGPFLAASPAYEISWSEGVELLGRIGLVLPTEAQWEAAARGGTDTPWWSGDVAASLMGAANIADRTMHARFHVSELRFSLELDDGIEILSSVGHLRANGFGLHDVAGNVAEWCLDPYGAPVSSARMGDGLRHPYSSSENVTRAGRGGAFQRPASSARSADREEFEAGTRLRYLGIRPARLLARHRALLPMVAPTSPESGSSSR